jgi:hypothetical protein
MKKYPRGKMITTIVIISPESQVMIGVICFLDCMPYCMEALLIIVLPDSLRILSPARDRVKSINRFTIADGSFLITIACDLKRGYDSLTLFLIIGG